MLSKFSSYKFAVGFIALLILILTACAPTVPLPQSGVEPTRPVAAAPTTTVVPTTTAAPTVPAAPIDTAVPTAPSAGADASGLDAKDILLQLTYEPGFVMPEYRYPFGRTPYFTLLADGHVIYIDENQDSRVMEAQLSQAEALALLQKVRDMGFAHLESHTDVCGTLANGAQTCIADASTTVMRVRMENGSLREISNYANFSNGPVTYKAIYNLLNQYTNPSAAIYVPHAATLFVRIVPQAETASPADWPLDPAYVKRAQATPDQFTAVALSANEASLWQKDVGINNGSVTFQLNGQPVSASFVPWLPGEDFSKEIAAEFPGK